MSENPLPKPTVQPATGSTWQASDVRAVLCNPVNVGLGPFKQLVPEDLWLKANGTAACGRAEAVFAFN